MDGTVEFDSLVTRLRDNFSQGKTKSLEWRRGQLEALKKFLQDEEEAIIAALRADLGKSDFEIYSSEIDFTRKEIDLTLKNLKKWMKPETVSTPLSLLPGKSLIAREPFGVALIISAWNYPFQLLLGPLVAAIAAGNCAVIKPSELAPESEKVITEKLMTYLDRDCFAVVAGGAEMMSRLLTVRFDHIFYTGGSAVGKIIMSAAAKYLTPVVLELGGKNVAVVLSDADIAVTAKRIIWGKFNNAGQLCVSPDYVLVDKRIEADLLAAMKQTVASFFGENAKDSKDYGRIINARHFDRLSHLLNEQECLVGGESDKEARYIAPTIIANARFSDATMQDELFGPILPVIGFDDLDGALAQAARLPTPLAIYCFTKDNAAADDVFAKLPSGSATQNDTLVFMTNPALPFGGVGSSGMGAYHGRHGFEAFSQHRAILKRGFFGDVAMRYPPYTKKSISILRKLM